MTQRRGYNSREWEVAIALTVLAASLSWGEKTNAQIIPDATLPNNSTVTSFGPFNTINGGTRAGNNLFHSFSEFSLPIFNVAAFNNAADIANIFSRVTGGNPSNLNGTLSVKGNANLFFLNPNGIIFGPNVQLLVGGSFISTTANAIGFGDREIYSATVPNDPSLLTIQPSFFQYDRAVTQPTNSIEVRGYLKVDPGNSILLVGGTGSILVDGTINSDPNAAFINAPGGKIEIGGLSAPGRIGLERDGNNPRLMSLTFPQGVEKSDVSLVNRGTLSTRGDNGGAISISADRLNVRESQIASSIVSAVVPNAQVGDITINVTEITLEGGLIVNGSAPGGVGDGGNINIAAQRLNMSGSIAIGTTVFGRGNAGNVVINVSESLKIDGQGSGGIPAAIVSLVGRQGVGDGGNVEIVAGSVDLANGAQIYTSTSGRGNAGNVAISVRESFNLSGERSDGLPTTLASLTDPGSEGNGGNVTITTSNLNVTSGAQIVAATVGRGNTGNVAINVSENLNLSGERRNGLPTQIGNNIAPGGEGKGGEVAITTGNLNITNGAQIVTATSGRENAGNVIIVAENSVNVDGEGRFFSSAIGSAVQPGAEGNGGTLELTTPNLNLTNGGQINVATLGQGNAGKVRIVASNVNLDGQTRRGASAIGSAVQPGATGNGGEIDMVTDRLNVTNGGQIGAASFGQGNGGKVRIVASDEINLDGQGNLAASAIGSSVQLGAVGNGGEIELATGRLNITNGAGIDASTYGRGNAGNVRIAARGPEGNREAGRITLDGEGRLGSSAIASGVFPGAVGNGGNLEITTGTLEMTRGGGITASTGGVGNGGNITIAARDRTILDGTGSFNSSTIGSLVLPSAVGDGGNLEITTGTLDVTNGGQISAETLGQGNGGNIVVTARGPEGNREAGRITLDGYGLYESGIRTSVNPGAVGKGGDITLAAPSIEITNRGLVSADSFGTGDAGDIVQIAARILYLDNGSITTQSPSGNGGNIRNLQVRDLLLMRNGSQISTTAGTQQSGGGNGGNININAGFVVAIPRENSDITANAFAGNGGNINISTQGIFGFSVQRFLTPRSDITASSQLGINGTINILTLGIDPNRGLVPPPLSPGAPNLPQSCQANAAQGGSRFIESDRGGLPPNPQEALGSSSLWSDARTSPSAANINPEAEPSGEIVEASGWVRGVNGTAILVGNAPTNSSVAIAGCYKR